MDDALERLQEASNHQALAEVLTREAKESAEADLEALIEEGDVEIDVTVRVGDSGELVAELYHNGLVEQLYEELPIESVRVVQQQPAEISVRDQPEDRRLREVESVIEEVAEDEEGEGDGASIEEVVAEGRSLGLGRREVLEYVESLKQDGAAYHPADGRIALT